MITYAEHLENVLRGLEPLQPLELGLMDAHGCVLAEDLVAPADLPGFDNSGMDGYAVRAEDVAGASEGAPVVLPVTGDVAAGPASPLRVMPVPGSMPFPPTGQSGYWPVWPMRGAASSQGRAGSRGVSTVLSWFGA